MVALLLLSRPRELRFIWLINLDLRMRIRVWICVFIMWVSENHFYENHFIHFYESHFIHFYENHFIDFYDISLLRHTSSNVILWNHFDYDITSPRVFNDRTEKRQINKSRYRSAFWELATVTNSAIAKHRKSPNAIRPRNRPLHFVLPLNTVYL